MLTALGIVGLVIIYHAGPRWLVPPVRPFSCGFCCSIWIAALVAAQDPSLASLWMVGHAALISGLVAAYTPLFYEPPWLEEDDDETLVMDLPEPLPASDEVRPFQDAAAIAPPELSR